MEYLWTIMGATRLQHRIKTQPTGLQNASSAGLLAPLLPTQDVVFVGPLFCESADPADATRRRASM